MENVLISLVVPVYNDYQTAEIFCLEFIKSGMSQTELIIVDNGSDDPALLAKLSELSRDQIRIVRLESNLGFGGGIQAGIKASGSDWVVWLPGNMKVDPSDLGPFLDQLVLHNQQALVKALRTGRSILATSKTALATFVQSVVSLSWMQDTGGTPTAMHRTNRIIGLLDLGPKDYTFESYVVFLANKLGVPLIRIRVPYGERNFGRSHWQSGTRSEIKLMFAILSGFPAWKKLAKIVSEREVRI